MPADPFYLQIMRDIRRRIASGEWPPGYPLPSTDVLTAMYREQIGIRSRVPVTRAVDLLVYLGVSQSHGVGRVRGTAGLAELPSLNGGAPLG